MVYRRSPKPHSGVRFPQLPQTGNVCLTKGRHFCLFTAYSLDSIDTVVDPIVGTQFFCYHRFMIQGIIDLRKPSPAKKEAFQAPHGASRSVIKKNTEGDEIEWTSYEHEYRIRGRYWFLYPLALATAGIVFGILTQSYLFIIFLLIAFIALVIYMKRPPRLLTFRIEKRGVWIGHQFHDFGKLESFWIFEHSLLTSELLLEKRHAFNSLLNLRLENVSVNDVKEVISLYLPEKEQKAAASHQIARIIGF